MNSEEFEKALKKTISPGKVREGLVDNGKFGEFRFSGEFHNFVVLVCACVGDLLRVLVTCCAISAPEANTFPSRLNNISLF